MRSFIISLILIFVIVGGAVFNDFYISSLVDDLISITKKLPDTFSDEGEAYVSQIKEVWEGNLTMLGLTVNQKYISSVTLALLNLCAAQKAQEKFDYLSSRDALIEALCILRSSQCAELQSII